MARTGVTEEQVAAAADKLLQAGERPTIERVRVVLGTGSPNTLIRHLDAWWKSLGTRLLERQRVDALPDAPPEVAEAALALWKAAMTQASRLAQAGVSEQVAELEALRAATREREQAAMELARADRERAAAADTQRQLADARVTELGRTCAQKDVMIQTLAADLERERASSQDLAETLRRTAEALDSAQRQAISDRDATAAYIKAVEDRAHAEIDRARQEAAAAAKRSAMSEKELSVARASAAKRVEELLREAGKRDAEIAGLKATLSSLRSGPRPRKDTSAAESPKLGSPAKSRGRNRKTGAAASSAGA